MKTRLLTSLCIVLTLALLFVLEVYVSAYFFDVFFMVIATIAAYEMSLLLTRMGRANNTILILTYPAFIATTSVLGMYFGLNIGYVLLIDLAIGVLMFALSFLWGIIFKKSTLNEMRIRDIKDQKFVKFSFKKSFNTFLGMIYPSFLLLTMVLLNHFDEIGFGNIAAFDGKFSLFIILFTFLIPMFTDSFAMLCGMVIGGKKLVPKISPNKTISGAIGGTLFCVLISACVYLILGAIDYFNPVINNIAIWEFLIIVFIGSIIAQAGDIFESFLKRKAAVKDSGKILPGHGGMLDRIDSYIYVAPYLLLAFICFILI